MCLLMSMLICIMRPTNEFINVNVDTQCIMRPTNEFINVNADTMHNAAYK